MTKHTRIMHRQPDGTILVIAIIMGEEANLRTGDQIELHLWGKNGHTTYRVLGSLHCMSLENPARIKPEDEGLVSSYTRDVFVEPIAKPEVKP